MRGKRRRPSGDCAIPSLTIPCGAAFVMSRPRKRIVPSPRVVEAVDRAERRRLAGAVRADQRHDLALVHRQRDALQRVDGAVVGVDVLELEDRAARPAAARRSSLTSPPCRDRPRSRARPSAPPAASPPRSSRRSRAPSRGRRCPSRPSCRARSSGSSAPPRSSGATRTPVKSAVSCGFIPAVGSSSSSSFGSVASARATSSRRWSP